MASNALGVPPTGRWQNRARILLGVVVLLGASIFLDGCHAGSRTRASQQRYETYYVKSQEEVDQIKQDVIQRNIGSGDYKAVTYANNTSDCPGGRLVRYDFGVNVVMCPAAGYQFSE